MVDSFVCWCPIDFKVELLFWKILVNRDIVAIVHKFKRNQIDSKLITSEQRFCGGIVHSIGINEYHSADRSRSTVQKSELLSTFFFLNFALTYHKQVLALTCIRKLQTTTITLCPKCCSTTITRICLWFHNLPTTELILLVLPAIRVIVILQRKTLSM